MKVIILAGGLGTRLSEETHVRPKPMVEIGGMPILWHIMKIYSHYGFNDFVIPLGYKGEYIKQWFADYCLQRSPSVSFDFTNGEVKKMLPESEQWRVQLVETGSDTMTGGRIKRLAEYIGNERFMLTYGDGVADVDIAKLVAFHESHGKRATMTTIVPAGRFGAVSIAQNQIRTFNEKMDNKKRVNGGFFVLEPEVFGYIPDGDGTIFEKEPLESLAIAGELMSFAHGGFWMPMDTLSDKHKLEALWETAAPWKVWK